MEKFKGTPAPWRVRRMDETVGSVFVEAKRLKPEHRYDVEILGDDANYPGEIKEADAQLIAAAPELLESLQGIIAITDRNHAVWDKAKLAIDKALTPSPTTIE